MGIKWHAFRGNRKTTLFPSVMNTNIIQEYKGCFWVAKGKKRAVPGIVTRYSDGRIELELIGSFDSNEKNLFGDFINSPKRDRVIFGLDSSSKDITLFATRVGVTKNLSCSFSLVTYKVIYLVYGKHVTGLDKPYKMEAYVRFPELTMWCPPKLIKHGFKMGENGIEKVFIETADNLHDTTIFEHKLKDGKNVSLKGNYHTETSKCNINPILTQWTSFCVSDDNGITLRKVLKTITRFEKFLSFASQKVCHYSDIQLFDEDVIQKTTTGKVCYLPIYLYINRSCDINNGRNVDVQYLFHYSEVADTFSFIISKWLDENDDMPLIIDHLVDSVISRRSINSAEFMTVVQGVDGFWQRFREDAYKTNNNLKKVGFDTAFRELRNEFDEILRYSKDQSTDDAIKDTRDFYSHLLKKGKKQNVLEGQGLYEATCYLRNLLMCCVMKETGFKMNTIKEIMKDY